ncbi:SHOCT domain-containing protein [Streptomyces sp. NPDC001530]|uniref:SHOCT domain-containing protein n=1 Tax=Streptomyces sp. NPDC001530 TaxID=3364582 RepID=UPI00369A47BD
MYWYHDGMTGWGWFAMSLSAIVFWALLVGAGILLFRALNRAQKEPHTPGAVGSPEQVLAERFARGEIDEDEYRRRLAVLREDSPKR